MSKIITSTFIYTGTNLITALSAFILLPIYTSYLSNEEFGIISAMQTLAAIFTILMTLAVEQSIFRLYHDFESNEKKKIFLGSIFTSILIIGVIVIILSFIGSDYISLIFPSVNFYNYYVYTILYAFTTGIFIFLKNIQQLNLKAGSFALLSLSNFFLIAFFTLYYLILKNEGAEGYVKAMLWGSLFSIVPALWLSKKYFYFNINWLYLKQSIKYSAPMLPSLLSAWVLNLSDRIFIDNNLSQSELGIYSLAFRISSIILLASAAFYTAYTPVFFDQATNRPEKEAKSFLSNANSIIISFIGMVSLVIFLFSKELLILFFEPRYFSSEPLIRMFCFSFFISQITGLLNLMFYQRKNTGLVTLSILISAIFNIFLNALLIPRFGLEAAVIVNILSNIINFLILLYYSNSKYSYYIKFPSKILISFLGIMFLLYYGLPYLSTISDMQIFVVKLFIFIVILVFLFYIYRNIIRNIFIQAFNIHKK